MMEIFRPRSYIPVYDTYISNSAKKYAKNAINSGWISSNGKYVELFEKNFSKFYDGFYSCATTNGTTALHLALIASGVKKGSTVIVPSFTYIATVNAIRYLDAIPLFIDIDRKNWQVDLNLLQEIDSNRAQFLLLPHIYGSSCDMNQILNILDKKRWILIEDCAEALGSNFKDKKLGQYGKCSTFSFFGNKTLTTGEGGMIISRDEKLISYCKFLRSHSMSISKRYWHEEVGYNYRMTNVVAALGVGQLKKINKIIKDKNKLHLNFVKLLSDLEIEFQNKRQEQLFWVTSLLFKNQKIKKKVTDIFDKNRIGWRPLFYPSHIMPMYKEYEYLEKTGFTLDLYKRGIIIPSYPTLRNVDIKKIILYIKKGILD